MADQWYYSRHNAQQGPVSPAELLALEKAGFVQGPTLVWKSGLAAWQPWAGMADTVRAEVAASGASAEELAVCAYSGVVRPVSQMVKYGDRYVAAESKDAFVQSLTEGARVGSMAGSSEVRLVGFWWRVLCLIIDTICLIVVSTICYIPYYILSFQNIFEQVQSGGPPAGNPMNPIAGLGAAAVIAYVGGTVAYFAFWIGYETWLTAKYGGTVGKMVCGFKVVKTDGERLGYGRAFGRWAAKFLNYIIWWGPSYVAMGIGFAVMMSSGGNDPTGFLVGMAVSMVLYVLCGFGFYMAGWTKRKQALHDIMAKTLVVRKNP